MSANNINMNSRRGMQFNQTEPCRRNDMQSPMPGSCVQNRNMPRQNAYMQGMRNNRTMSDERQDCGCMKDNMRTDNTAAAGRMSDNTAGCADGRDRMPSRCVPDRGALMRDIYQLGFALVETVLFLDTHPADADALNYYNQIKKRYNEAMEIHAREYGPLLNSNVMNENYWSWVATPMPWEVEGC